MRDWKHPAACQVLHPRSGQGDHHCRRDDGAHRGSGHDLQRRVIPECDTGPTDGHKWVRDVIATLDGKCQSLEIRAPRTGNDPAEHIAAGHSLDELYRIELVPDEVDGVPPPDEESVALGKILKRSELSSLPKVEQLVDGVLSIPATAVLVGGYGVGKTFLAIGLGNSVGTGLPWLGRKVRKRRVLYVLGEGAYGLDHRLTTWESAWHKGKPVSDDDVTYVVQPDSLAKSVTWDAVTLTAINGAYGFVILDTFSSLAPDADETKDAAMVMRRMSNLATSIQGTVLLVHHPGWSDNTRTRGGYQFEANADEDLVATEISKGSDMFTLLRKKVKDGQALYLQRVVHTGSCYIQEVHPDQTGIPMRDRIRVILNNYGDLGATGPQIQTEVGVEDKERSTFYKALQKLVGDRIAGARGTGNARRYYLRRDGEADE